MHTFSSEGIILKRVDFGEADKLLTIFTKNRGKVTTLARGIRRIESRRAGNVELLNKAKLFFAESKSLPILTEAESLETYADLKKDLKRVGHAYYLTELVDQFFHDREENYRVFELLAEVLSLLDKVEAHKAENIVRAFELKLLSLAGYGLEVNHCVKCKSILEPNGNFLSVDSGGILDEKCTNGSLLAKSITPEEIKILRFAQEKPINETARIKVSDKLTEELREKMRLYLEHILERQISSADFAEKVKKLE